MIWECLQQHKQVTILNGVFSDCVHHKRLHSRVPFLSHLIDYSLYMQNNYRIQRLTERACDVCTYYS